MINAIEYISIPVKYIMQCISFPIKCEMQQNTFPFLLAPACKMQYRIRLVAPSSGPCCNKQLQTSFAKLQDSFVYLLAMSVFYLNLNKSGLCISMLCVSTARVKLLVLDLPIMVQLVFTVAHS